MDNTLIPLPRDPTAAKHWETYRRRCLESEAARLEAEAARLRANLAALAAEKDNR
jgi:hypothetical protein